MDGDQPVPGAVHQMDRRLVDDYQRDGFVLLRGVISQDWLRELGDVVEELKNPGVGSDAYVELDESGDCVSITKDDVWRESETMLRFLRESPVARLAAQAMRSSQVRIYEALLIYKATAAGATPWHQDEGQWPVSGRQLTSIWFSLDGTTPETGALRFVAGSHMGPLYIPYSPPERLKRVAEDMHFFTGGKLPDVDAEPDRFEVRTFSTEPGDAILFHPRALHASFGSSQDHSRRTFSIRFLGDDVRWQPKASVYHDWLRDIRLPEGAVPEHERFPSFYQAREHA